MRPAATPLGLWVMGRTDPGEIGTNYYENAPRGRVPRNPGLEDAIPLGLKLRIGGAPLRRFQERAPSLEQRSAETVPSRSLRGDVHTPVSAGRNSTRLRNGGRALLFFPAVERDGVFVAHSGSAEDIEGGSDRQINPALSQPGHCLQIRERLRSARVGRRKRRPISQP